MWSKSENREHVQKRESEKRCDRALEEQNTGRKEKDKEGKKV